MDIAKIYREEHISQRPIERVMGQAFRTISCARFVIRPQLAPVGDLGIGGWELGLDYGPDTWKEFSWLQGVLICRNTKKIRYGDSAQVGTLLKGPALSLGS